MEGGSNAWLAEGFDVSSAPEIDNTVKPGILADDVNRTFFPFPDQESKIGGQLETR